MDCITLAASTMILIFFAGAIWCQGDIVAGLTLDKD